MLILPAIPEHDRTCLNCQRCGSPVDCPGRLPGKVASDCGCGYWKESHASIFSRMNSKIAEQAEQIAEDNEVCICGCSSSEHESLGEDGAIASSR